MTPVITWDDLTPDEKKSALLSIQWQRESAARKAAELAREQEKLRRMDPYPRALRTETEPIRVEEHEAFGFADGIKGRERSAAASVEFLLNVDGVSRAAFDGADVCLALRDVMVPWS